MGKSKAKHFCRILRGCLSLSAAICLTYTESLADIADSIHLLKTSPSDSRAIVKMEDGTMKIIKPGDMIGTDKADTKIKVMDISEDTVVFEQKGAEGAETLIIRLERDGKGNSTQRVERLRRTRPEPGREVVANVESSGR